MKRSVKLVLAGLAVVMAVAGLAGCGQDKAGGTAKKPETNFSAKRINIGAYSV